MKTRYDRAREALKPWQFTLSLSNTDMKEFYRLAYMTGATPAEILQGFICDLVDGTQTRGSDERWYAGQYLERCCYDLLPPTFLTWALNDCRLDEIAELLETLKYAAGDLAYYAENPTDPDGTPECIKELEQERAEAEQGIKDIYKEYAEAQEPAQELQEGIEGIKAYLKEMEAIDRA